MEDDDYSRAAAAKRLDFVREATGVRPAHLGRYSLNPAAVAGNVENFIGVAGMRLDPGELPWRAPILP